MKLILPVAIVTALLVPAHAATYYVALSGQDTSPGTAAAPWRTIQHAVDALQPGDAALVGPGTYREAITMRRSGTAAALVTVAAVPGARVIVTGADRLDNGWSKVDGTTEAVYVHDWDHIFPIGTNPDGTPALTHPGDREHELTGRAEQVIHGGRLLRQVLRREQVAQGTFYVDLAAKKLYVWLRGSDDPERDDVEASTRGEWLVGSGVSYIHVRGITFRYAANHAQRGAFAIRSAQGNPARGWLVEDCIFERSNAAGGSFNGMGHVFRRCVFQDNGQLGFGTSRCDNTRMENCGIYRNNTKGYSTGWEAGGLKVTMSRGFVFDHCRSVDNRGTGIWYDIGNEQSEISHCTIADNDEAGIFYEISYSLHAHDNLIVNNANRGESPGGAWGSGGITLSSSEDCIVENNTLISNRDGIDFREQNRTTPRINAPPDTHEVRVFNRNHIIRNNIVADSQAFNIGFWMDTRFFGPHPGGGDKNAPLTEDPRALSFRFSNNLLWPLPGRANYLYGAPWRSASKQFSTPAEFEAATGIPDNSRVADPRFLDIVAGYYRLPSGSAAGLGVRP